ncbi:hypothetical protein FISHEDRAFT_77636 [Fistulina hepatica ATCC 64428]|uniref:Uncharacterized protein n=1 Tax=Fistulina hepatica ATCC 64428 TaxID=1128425 RepID=A0A0D7A140_9AGAR|nr:hypothetical protein FISHEDRAFT_77636 [Fistulina hepatica ATCC 64428]
MSPFYPTAPYGLPESAQPAGAIQNIPEHEPAPPTSGVSQPPRRQNTAPRKRPKYTRSKTGCMTCRSKKVKAGFSQPPQIHPINRPPSTSQRECIWPETVPPWPRIHPASSARGSVSPLEDPSAAPGPLVAPQSSILPKDTTVPVRPAWVPARSYDDDLPPPISSRRLSEPRLSAGRRSSLYHDGYYQPILPARRDDTVSAPTSPQDWSQRQQPPYNTYEYHDYEEDEPRSMRAYPSRQSSTSSDPASMMVEQTRYGDVYATSGSVPMYADMPISTSPSSSRVSARMWASQPINGPVHHNGSNAMHHPSEDGYYVSSNVYDERRNMYQSSGIPGSQ